MLKIAAEFQDAKAKANVVSLAKYYDAKVEDVQELQIIMDFAHKTKWTAFCGMVFERKIAIAMTLQFS